jgi:hypothetical protein
VFLKLGLRSYPDIVRECKLFDFERGRWTQFEQAPLTAVERLAN